jgi:hypothetical protein
LITENPYWRLSIGSLAIEMKSPLTVGDGVGEARLESWLDFSEFINSRFLDLPHYIWRGHRRSDWRLEPTLTRVLKGKADSDEIQQAHLTNFRFAIRGRRGTNPTALSDEEAWAIGQHSFLASPLLDWTSSPYVALFFAFAEPDAGDKTDCRVVFGLNELRIKQYNQKAEEDNPVSDEKFITFFRPLSDENARLVNQAGLFTSTAGGLEIEDWVRVHFSGVANRVILSRIMIPNNGRHDCLKALAKMNITYATLFPDLYGASKHCNLKLEISNY